MGLTLQEILQLDVLRAAEAEVVAGSGQLERSVRWVHIAELPDIAYLLKGGELLLTTGVELGGDAAVQRRYIRDLAQAGAAGLVVELGRAFTELPPSMVQEAERCELPVIALHREIRYVDVTEQVHGAIISRQFQLLQKAEDIGRDFTNLVLSGSGLKRVLYRLAAIVENPVVLEDVAHQVVEFVDRLEPVGDMLHHWERHSRVGHEERTRGLVHREAGTQACIWVGIWLRHEPWGRLHVLARDSPLDEIDHLALDRAAAAVGLSLLGQQDAAHLAERARNALITDVVQGRYASGEEVFSRARNLGAELSGRSLVALVVQPVNLSTLANDRSLSEAEHQRVRGQLLAETRRAAQAAGSGVLCGQEGDGVLALLGVPPGRTPSTVEQVASDLHRRAAGYGGGLRVVIGVSDEADPERLPRAFDEAKNAARYGIRVSGERSFFRFGELGIDQLLFRLAEGPDLGRFVEFELKALLEHDARTSSALLPTLRAYLQSGGRKSEAARALHIERRTLYHRLERVESILGQSLSNQETIDRLSLAVRGLDLLRQP